MDVNRRRAFHSSAGKEMTKLADKVRFLSDPAVYPRATTSIEARETHMSWVFLADEHVYKLKKPVKYPYLDFSTLSCRKFFCEEELRLNRRLAGQTYRAVVPLCLDRRGRLNLCGSGRAVDWLVVMRRLPEGDMLDSRLGEGRVDEADIRRVGELMSRFYSACAPQIADGGLYLKHLAGEQAINRAVLQRPELGVGKAAAPMLDAVDRALERLAPCVAERIAEGRIVEGHGDLRPEHVHLGEPVQVIDCLEFNRAMRIIDPYDEVNYLGLECAILGAPWIRTALLDILAARLGGRPDTDILALYGGFRALMRARLCVAHLFEAEIRHPGKWKPLALSYIALATSEFSLPCRPGQKSNHFPGGD